MTLRILTQLNFSAGENPEADSGLRFTGRLIREIQAASDGYFFYVLAPKGTQDHVEAILDCPRVHVIPTEIPPRLHGGDFAFDPSALYTSVDFRKCDIDVLFLNQPETVAPFLNFFNRQTFHLVPSLTYVHWFDTRRPGTPKHRTHHPALLAALTGLASSSAAGCNSEFGKATILEHAERWLSAGLKNELAAKLYVLPPPIGAVEISRALRTAPERKRRKPVKLLINHRVLKYTGVRQLIETTLPALWDIRQDFRAIITNPSRARLPRSLLSTSWSLNGTLSGDAYFDRLCEADIVLAPHRATHWSISTLEGVASGCLPICNQEGFFPEMFEPVLARMSRGSRDLFARYCLFYRGNLIPKMQQAMDDMADLMEFRRDLARRTRQVYDWRLRVGHWTQLFDQLYASVPAMPPENPTMAQIIEIIERERNVSKAELLRMMRWSPKTRTLSWTTFRKTLRDYTRDDAGSSELMLRSRRRPRSVSRSRQRLLAAE